MDMSRVLETNPTPDKQKEGPVARAIENQTAKLPSDIFLWGALASMGASLVLQLSGAQKTGNFVAQWVPTLLLFGVYNKIVKVAGNDRATSTSAF